MLGVASVVLRAAGGQLHPAPDSYDGFVASFGPRLVSYWKFQNDGADANGTQHAEITGSPELNVETIVDLDTIAAGAPADGECIAWWGFSGVYAQAAHNAQHKTAQGTIIVTFQHDTLSVKSTLLAADRAAGGTSTGAGGLAMEVTTDGAPRCFLRRQSGGTVVQLLGQAGDVQLNHAYTLIFKWGPGGLSMALWDAAEGLVRRVTDPLEDGVTGTSPIRFGAWHTDISHHDGPYGRVVWLNRRISDAEEAILPRPRTIVRETAPPVGEFPFVTILTPTVSHAGVANRPGYSPTDPRSASIIDPMSSIEIVRLTGNFGTNVLIDGTTPSGLAFPHSLRPDNSGTPGRVWNADGSMLFFDQSRTLSGDPGNAARSILIDMDGSRTGAPGRIIRAGSSPALGQGHSVWWFWDPLNPARAYVQADNGAMYEWWPVGEQGHSQDELNQLYGGPAGFNQFRTGRAHLVHCSWDGQYFIQNCRRTSDGRRGGIRLNLLTGERNPFVVSPHTQNDDQDRTAQGTSALGRYSKFTFSNQQIVRDMVTGQIMFNTSDIGLPVDNFSHSDWTAINGREYLVAPVGGQGIYMVDILTGTPTRISTFSTGNPNHMSNRNTADLAETYGQVGSVTSGQRYGFLIRSNGTNERGIRAFRMDPNGPENMTRYICNHRCERTDASYSNLNESEAHCQPSPDGRKVAFPSNWRIPGVVTDYDIHGYVALIPDAWWSQNHSGS